MRLLPELAAADRVRAISVGGVLDVCPVCGSKLRAELFTDSDMNEHYVEIPTRCRHVAGLYLDPEGMPRFAFD